MKVTKMEQKGRKIVVSKLYCFISMVFLTTHASIAQSTLPISFQYKEPRHGRTESASYFLGEFSFRAKVPSTSCYYAMGSYRFRVASTGVIDSIAFTGNMYDELIKLGYKSIRESQAYWVCLDCEKKGGHWFTIPVYVAYTTGLNCPTNEFYKQSSLFWYTLFKTNGEKQLEISEHEWLLAPIYAISMR